MKKKNAARIVVLGNEVKEASEMEMTQGNRAKLEALCAELVALVEVK